MKTFVILLKCQISVVSKLINFISFKTTLNYYAVDKLEYKKDNSEYKQNCRHI